MWSQFRKVHRSPRLPITIDIHAINCLGCLSVWSGPSLLIKKVYVPVMHFYPHTLQGALESEQEASIVLIDFSAAFDRIIIRAFFISSHYWILGVLCCLCWHSLHQTDHITLWWMVVWVDGYHCFRSAAGLCFGSIIVTPVHLGAFYHSGE